MKNCDVPSFFAGLPVPDIIETMDGLQWKILLKWMMIGDTPILGNHHIIPMLLMLPNASTLPMPAAP